MTGIWNGKGAKLLGLSGTVEKSEFDHLCDNRNPDSGEQLTLRNSAGRTVGYDFNFHVPKGLSVAYEVMGDERILSAFNKAVDQTMQEIEQDAATRIRKHYSNMNRQVGNMVWAKFVHKTARPVDGIPDPHLHAHCFVMNALFDDKENAWKAGQFREIKRDARYFEAAFHARLAADVKALGYTIEKRGKNWDIAQVPEAIASKFSRRTELIEKLAEKKGISDAQMKAELGASSREKKDSELSMPELRAIWIKRLSDEETNVLQIKPAQPIELEPQQNAASMRHAIEHSFERSSAVPKRHVLAEALRHGVGNVSVEGVAQELERQKVIVREVGNRQMATTAKVLAEEKAMLTFVKEGRNSQQPLVTEWDQKREWLNKDQREAVGQLLASKDRVAVIRGGAGTGKTTLMSEAIEAIENQGTPVFTFAPSAEASRGVLAAEGFNATTVAELLVSEKLQNDVAKAVLWIDEAGLLSSKQLKGVLDIAKAQGNRVVLSGDPKQHQSVERGSVLQMLEEEGAVMPIIVQKIERQKGSYKTAIEHLSVGNTKQGLDELQQLGWLKEIENDDERWKAMAIDYADQIAKGNSTLVVAPTHAESAQATERIREELKARALIGKKDFQFKQLKPVHFTTAEKRDPSLINSEDVLVFHQNIPGIKRGISVKAIPEILSKAIQYPDRFSVYRDSQIEISKGDKIRITRGGKTLDEKHRLYNGNVFQVKRFDRKGNLVLKNGWKLDKDFGHITMGYVSTSHASQGKTVDHVFVVESSTSFAAAGKEQLYVSVSRGRKKATIYTDSIEEFREAVSRSQERITATGMMKSGHQTENAKRRQRMVQQEKERAEQHNTQVQRNLGAEYARI